MTPWIRTAWEAHPILTCAEGLVALALCVELVMVAHMALGALVGAVTGNPEAFIQTRFVFMTGEDARFFAGFLGALALIPATVLLAAIGGIGWVHAALVGAPTTAFTFGLLGALGTLLVATGLVIAGHSFGGGILPR